ncbi:MAG: NAD(P)H-dependent oxidoreductase [Actinomycetota bacterium]|nr:NAD(P)H-dependent oxidoreductase [Actinomycetota bacterium]
MTNLLHISSSPRAEASESLALADTFLDAFTRMRPDVSIDHWDLWDGSLPSFGPEGAGAKMRIFAGEEPVGPQETAWHRARLAFERFAAADLYVFSVPMWNAGIPYILKQFIDVVSQPGMLFGFDPDKGYSGLLQGKRAVTLYTSAVYGPQRPREFGSDFQAPYLEDWLQWAGIEHIRSVQFRPNLVATTVADRTIAHQQANMAGTSFALHQPSRAA